MPWARLSDDWHDHPKVIAAGLEAAGLWVMCLTWAHKERRRANTIPGYVPVTVVTRLGGRNAAKLARKLREVGLFDEHPDGGWLIHDFADYLPKYDPEQARAVGAKGGRAKRTAKQTASEPLSGVGGGREATRADARVDPNPSPNPNPVRGSVVPSLKAVPGERADGLDLDRIADELGSDEAWAARVAGEVLARSGADPADSTAYVIRSVRNEPSRYRPTPTPGRLARCAHGLPAGSCGPCIDAAAAVTA